MFVAVRNTRRAKSLADLTEGRVQANARTRLGEAMATKWTFDAHLYPYSVKSSQDQDLAVSRSFLPAARESGDDLLLEALFVDFDLPSKRSWKDREEAQEALAALEKLLPIAPTYLYTTLHGLRAVWELSEPLPVDEGEVLLKSFLTLLLRLTSALPARVDLACSDWTRCYRLPKVIRDGRKSWEQPWFILKQPSSKPADTEALKELCDFAHFEPKEEPPISPDYEVVGSQPTEQEVVAMLYDEQGRKHGRMLSLQKRLGGTLGMNLCYYADTPEAKRPDLPPVGERYPTMKTVVGKVVGYAIAWDPELSPQEVYALLYHWAAAMREQGYEKDPPELLWDLIRYAWPREMAQKEAREREKRAEQERRAEESQRLQVAVQTREKQAEELMEELLPRVMEWLTLPEFVHLPIGQKKEWILRHLILLSKTATAQGIVLQRDGRYTSYLLKPSRDTLPTLVDSLQMGPLYNLTEVRTTPDGFSREIMRPMHAVFREHGSPILDGLELDSTLLKPQLVKSHMGGYLYRFGFVRTSYPPQFNQQIQDWLLGLFGERKLEVFASWLKAALDFSRPVPALILCGPAGVGKSMMAQEITKFLGFAKAAGSQVLQGWSGDLMETGVVILDEGLPTNVFQRGLAAQTFKNMISGASLSVNKKYGGVFTIRSFVRVVSTVNSEEEVLFALLDSDFIDKENLDAINRRFLILDLNEDGRHFLDLYGNWMTTNAWVKEDLLASHLQWLADQAEVDEFMRFKIDVSEYIIEDEFGEEAKTQKERVLSSVPEAIELAKEVYDFLNLNKKSPKEKAFWWHGQLCFAFYEFYQYLMEVSTNRRFNQYTSTKLGRRLSLFSATRVVSRKGRKFSMRLLNKRKFRALLEEVLPSEAVEDLFDFYSSQEIEEE